MSAFSPDENVSGGLLIQLEARGHGMSSAWQAGTPATHDRDDCLLVHRAWRAWFAGWGTPPHPRHAGIVAIPQPPLLLVADAADVIDRLIRASRPGRLANRCFAWGRGAGWREERAR